MRATQMMLVAILLAAMASACQAQLLLRRRMGNAVGQMTLDAGARLFDEAVNKVREDPASVIKDVRVSVNVSASPASPKVLLDHGCNSVLLSETARLAEKLKAEKFSPPVLEKMYFDYAGVDVAKAAASTAKGNSWSSQQLLMFVKSEQGDLPKDRVARTSVTRFEHYRPQDPRSKSPPSVHGSLVFLTQKDNQQFRKTVDFDLSLEQQKKEAGSTAADPWTVKNVQYDRKSTNGERRP